MRGSRIVRALAAVPPAERIARTLASVAPRRRDVLAVLTFHRVAPTAGVVPGLLSATPGSFAHLLDVVADQFRILSIDEVLERERGGTALPPRSLLLTIDDGYRDVADHIWPELTRRGLPATLFVPTAFPGSPEASFWWERAWAVIASTDRSHLTVDGRSLPVQTAAERASAYRAVRTFLKSLPHDRVEPSVARLEDELGFPPGRRPAPSGRSLDWPGLRELQAAGLALGSHTRTHPLLTRVDDRVLADEIGGGVADLAREARSDLPAFAYPSGEVRDAAVVSLREAGIRVAFTTERGVNDLRDGRWLQLRRINVGLATPPSLILAQAVR
jgi:peptidoglycan/xylan/chitin deacetylase (PgdA/CDA1 family)